MATTQELIEQAEAELKARAASSGAGPEKPKPPEKGKTDSPESTLPVGDGAAEADAEKDKPSPTAESTSGLWNEFKLGFRILGWGCLVAIGAFLVFLVIWGIDLVLNKDQKSPPIATKPATDGDKKTPSGAPKRHNFKLSPLEPLK